MLSKKNICLPQAARWRERDVPALTGKITLRE
jgi:hypothetical protein